MHERERLARRPSLVARCAVLLALSSGGCSLGFDAFDPVAGGAADSSTPSEAGADASQDSASADDTGAEGSSETDTGAEQDSASSVEAGCPGMQSCLSAAGSCGMTCNQAYGQCTGMCMGGNTQQCRNACKSTEQKCRGTCSQTCSTCTSQAGCPDDSGCATAAQM